MKTPFLALSLLGLFSLAASLHAQSVSFVRNIPLPAGHSPLIRLRTDSAVTPYLYLVANLQIWRMAREDTSWELIDEGISGVKMDPFAKVMLDNADPSAQNLAFFGLNLLVYEYSLNNLVFMNSHGQYPAMDEVQHFAPFGVGHGLFLDGSGIQVASGKQVWDINLGDGTLTRLFGGLNNAWNIQAASDGGIWVLGNNDTAQLQKFTLTSGVWSATTSFSLLGTFDGTIAMATSGELLLGDGLGGGSLYSPTGTLLQTFTPPSTVVFDPATQVRGASYINIDSTGMITVYTNTDSFSYRDGQEMYNVYQFTGVPEPSTGALLVVALGCLALRRRKRLSKKR